MKTVIIVKLRHKDLAFGNRKFRDMVQAASNWEDANRIKTNADKLVIMMFSKIHISIRGWSTSN